VEKTCGKGLAILGQQKGGQAVCGDIGGGGGGGGGARRRRRRRRKKEEGRRRRRKRGECV
jgi:hypothetical protein